MSDVRPIGDEFEQCTPPSMCSTEIAFTVFRYKVVRHAEIEGGRTAAVLDPIDIKKYPVSKWALWLGEFRPVPPPECVELLDEGWQALHRAHWN